MQYLILKSNVTTDKIIIITFQIWFNIIKKPSKENIIKYIFLDFDGVINNFYQMEGISLENVKILK